MCIQNTPEYPSIILAISAPAATAHTLPAIQMLLQPPALTTSPSFTIKENTPDRMEFG